MKITFVGTSHGVPFADRYCTCTMIESGNSVYFIDAGRNIIDSVLRYGKSPYDVRAIFTTHTHGDHTSGLFQYCDLVDWYYKDHAFDLYTTDQPYIDALVHLLESTYPDHKLHADRVRMHCIDPTVPYEDENIKIEYIPTKHIAAPYHSYAMLVTEGEKRVLFSGDLSHKLKHADVPKVLFEESVDAFICEMAHFGMDDIRPYLEKANTKAVYFQHVYPLPKYDDIAAQKNDFSFPIHCPNDGDVVEI